MDANITAPVLYPAQVSYRTIDVIIAAGRHTVVEIRLSAASAAKSSSAFACIGTVTYVHTALLPRDVYLASLTRRAECEPLLLRPTWLE